MSKKELRIHKQFKAESNLIPISQPQSNIVIALFIALVALLSRK